MTKYFSLPLAKRAPLISLRRIFIGSVRYRARKAAEGCVMRASIKESMAGEVLATRSQIDILVAYTERCIRAGEVCRPDVVRAMIHPKHLSVFDGDDVTRHGMNGIVAEAKAKHILINKTA